VDDEASPLLARCVAGDQEACTALVESFARMVGTVIWRATGDADVVEDLAQETFMRVFRALPQFRGQAKLSTWVCTIAHRVAVDHVRKRAAGPVFMQERDDQVGDAGWENVADSATPDPEAIVSTAEMDRLLREQVGLLPDRYRLPLVYAAIDGLDYETIAAMLDMPIGTVKTMVFRAKQRLRSQMHAALRAPRGAYP
jgi:RNA polymerase sigma-70 factor (ECF subfamily)